MSVVITKCEFTYIQLAASITKAWPAAQACTAGSKKSPRSCSMWITERALSNASAARESTSPRAIR